MAIIAGDQITIVDITDAYSVFLSTESITFTGTTADGTNLGSQQSTQVRLSALCGTSTIQPSVDTNSISKPTNIDVSVGSYDSINHYLPITVTAFAALTPANLVSQNYISFPVTFNDGAVTVNKMITISASFKGNTGTGGVSTTTVLIGNESTIIPCDEDGYTLASMDITIPFAGYVGASRADCSLITPVSVSPMSTKTYSNATTVADGQLVITAPENSTLGGDSSGEITLNFACNSTTQVKKFSWAKAISGQTGNEGAAGAAAVSIVCGNESIVIPCTKEGLVSSASTVVVPFAGYVGTNRATCSVTYSSLPNGMTLHSNGNISATTTEDGSLTFDIAANANLGGASVLNGDIALTFSCNNTTQVKYLSWAKSIAGQTGPQGDPGEDAILLTVDSSAGNIFKNNNVNSTLTAHVYKAGIELPASSVAALGTIYWYKDNSFTTPCATGVTLSINASSVTDRAIFTARLESGS